MSNNKNEVLKVKLKSQNERMHYLGFCAENEVVSIDYIQPMGDEKGYTSLELLLISLSSCITSTVGVLLRSRGIKIRKIDADATGYRRKEHPMGFENIIINIIFYSEDLKKENVNEALNMAESIIAPVWCMLKESAKIEVKYEIEV